MVQERLYHHNPLKHRLAAYMHEYPVWATRSSNPFCLKFSCVITQSYLQKNIHDSQLHKNAWEPGYVQLLRYSGRISSLFPWGFETPCGWTWSSWAHSAGKNLLHIAHMPKKGLLWWVCWKLCFEEIHTRWAPSLVINNGTWGEITPMNGLINLYNPSYQTYNLIYRW